MRDSRVPDNSFGNDIYYSILGNPTWQYILINAKEAYTHILIYDVSWFLSKGKQKNSIRRRIEPRNQILFLYIYSHTMKVTCFHNKDIYVYDKKDSYDFEESILLTSKL